MLFEVILRQLYGGRNILNRWNYNSSGTPAAVQLSFALAEAFGGIPAPVTSEFTAGTIMQLLSSIQSNVLTYVELQVEALYDFSDFYTVPYAPSQIATAPGTPMSPFVAYALQSNRVRTDIRRGNKRFAGVSETFVDNLGVLNSGILPPLDDLAEAMTDPLVYDDEGTPLTFTPVVLSLEKHPPDAEHAVDWYRQYSTLALQLDHAAIGVSWIAKSFMTTQNTRKS